MLPQERSSSWAGEHDDDNCQSKICEGSNPSTAPAFEAGPSELINPIACEIAPPPRNHAYTEAESAYPSIISSVSLYERLLNPTSCRVLHILPGERDDQLVCSLSGIDLSKDQIKYEALSYVWGSRLSPAEIMCNGRLISVTRNLKDGLQRIRCENTTRVVWIDAICINQLDQVERGQQVRMMRSIYHNAATVLVWLGHLHSEYAERCFSTLRNFGNLSKVEQDWEPVRRFYQLEYFKRIWVLQEVAQAPSAHLIWGDSEIAWNVVRLATFRIRNDKDVFLRL